jgi:hypothetical protein
MNFSKFRNLKLGISVYKICRWTPGYRIFTNTILQGEIAFDANVTLNHVVAGPLQDLDSVA